jgi:HK97 family phage prohead protease
MKLEKKDLDFEIKLAGAGGRFTGHGSVFNVLDSYNEIIAPGAFAQTLQDRKAKGRALPILWQHRTSEPLGVFDVATEDDKGLYLEGRLLVDHVPQAKQAHELMKAGALSGLSIGFSVKSDSFDQKERVRTMTAVELYEVSLVTFPANDDARIETVKSMPAFESMRGCEDWLRSAMGMSANDSKAFIAQFRKALVDPARRDAEETLVMREYLSLLRKSSALPTPRSIPMW